MSSFSCQYLDKNETYCIRLKTDCVPGRNGCVLKGRFVFALPAEKRLEEKMKSKNLSGEEKIIHRKNREEKK
ncbi:MAG: hypothetical protein HYS25_03595 [Ignavibacteriales bacterium]|nr:hypothetical protein [Ignavibacteriales bacterium]